jgi:hypothetical protein
MASPKKACAIKEQNIAMLHQLESATGEGVASGFPWTNISILLSSIMAISKVAIQNMVIARAVMTQWTLWIALKRPFNKNIASRQAIRDNKLTP